ncbi:MAG: Cu(I)-responsive transcriptional regulator [Rhodospirillaceae bacterium]|jgi:Cu(I)-responsive transcriptional regulator|nr:Cu(I)-responsive transcriptional regulator [Rhodospirillaceae bacterium]MBT4427165.1 Cu(I)-responsive transcriptional regulator [Rhodospirillaceae bacterium]MBT5040203.1 Cu(I)-responsive transcriptional regulator [Rhodospirillaceae bacterium]MBT5677211.1 Cu(I)-responsive transcriptional regulator [Rhodospirillaceae bacterium]MBT5777950.1 Cu(I)-responsive transcriptional regulator [Rhodospirillaceae bacterium]
MQIGLVAERSGVPAKTIRYYEEIGLVAKPLRTDSGYRSYDKQDVDILRFVSRARSLGFSIKDVRNLLTLFEDRERASADVKKIALEHVDEIDQKMAELDSIRHTLLHLADKCHGDERPEYPILDGLAHGPLGVRGE